MKQKYEIAAYYFPNFHTDAKQEKWFGANWTEWELLKAATPRFVGHQQPKIPLWGYEDEANPLVMAKKIDAAADHGMTAFIFDWYWFDNEPFLQRALEEGFLKAENNHKLQFSLMWANHSGWLNNFPADKNLNPAKLADGRMDYERFTAATDYMINQYLSQSNYWRVDGGLYLSFYELDTLVEDLGGIVQTHKALEEFRNKVRDAGLGELHLNAIMTTYKILSSETAGGVMNELLNQLGFNSATSYVWLHHQEMNEFPFSAYSEYRQRNELDFTKLASSYTLPYYPHVTMGWDSSPRTKQSDAYENLSYPFTPILSGNTPEEFQKALESAKEYFDAGSLKQNILTINAWNEWTEGSYLEPDLINGMGYLEAIRNVFGVKAVEGN